MLMSKFVVRFERLVVQREQLGNVAPLRDRSLFAIRGKVVDPAVVGAEEEARAGVCRVDGGRPHGVAGQFDVGLSRRR